MTADIGDRSAAERNKQPIFDALAPWLAAAETVLEIGAGDATHARYATTRLPGLCWQASEAPGHYRRLAAAIADSGEYCLPAPIALDVRYAWPEACFDVVYAANVAHIMAWDGVAALFAGAGACLHAGGLLCLYGPFFEREAGPAAIGNRRFDAALRAQSPAMGLREIADLDALAAAAGLASAARIAMPADNRLLLWRSAERVDGC